jgi:hypothetical protein
VGLLVIAGKLEWVMFFTSNNELFKQVDRFAVVETAMTLHAELMLLCARVGYSPPVA